MSAASSIEWTDKTWNPVRGCSIVSPGCVNCYAMKQAHRFSGTRYDGSQGPYYGLTKHTKVGPQWTGIVRTADAALLEPLSWRKPQRVFVNSMSDLFHEGVPDEFIDRVFAVMALAPQHTFQILTKRPERMLSYLVKRPARCACGGGDAQPTCVGIYENPTDPPSFGCDDCCGHGNEDGFCRPIDWPLPNVWLGVSVENQHFADERIPLLLQTPAAVRFISAEPLLGPVKLDHMDVDRTSPWCQINALTGRQRDMGRPCPDVPKLDWVIVGGESGPGARPCALEWLESIVAQCEAAGVPCFVKQLGAYVVSEERTAPADCFADPTHPKLVKASDGDYFAWRMGTAHTKGGDITEFPENLRVREFPQVRA